MAAPTVCNLIFESAVPTEKEQAWTYYGELFGSQVFYREIENGKKMWKKETFTEDAASIKAKFYHIDETFFKTRTLVEEVDSNTRVYLVTINAIPYVISPREYLVEANLRELENGGFVVSYKSTEHAACPITDAAVRCEATEITEVTPIGDKFKVTVYCKPETGGVPSAIADKIFPYMWGPNC